MNHSVVHSFSFKKKPFIIAVKNYTKADTKAFWSCSIFLASFYFLPNISSNIVEDTLLLLHYEGHCMKSVRMRSFFWSIFSHIRTESKMGKKKSRTRTPFLQCMIEMKTNVYSVTDSIMSDVIANLCNVL